MKAYRARSFLLILLAVDKMISLLNIFLFPVPLDLFISSLRIVLSKLCLTLV